MRNKMRIVCNPIAKHISYYLKNEHDEWLILTGSSILSRNSYTCTTMKEKASEIAFRLDEIYNRNNYPMTAKCTDLQKKWGIQIKRTTRYNKGNSYGVIEFNI